MINLLQQWENEHRKDILDSLKKAGIDLTLENIPEIIEETSFKTRSEKYPEKCPYYQLGYSCHRVVSDLNCFLCACPNYESGCLEGGCKINSPKGKFHVHPNLPMGRVWDCSACAVNHSPDEIKRYLIEHISDLKE